MLTSRPLALALALSVLCATTPATPALAVDPPYERVLNGTFDAEKEPWWSSGNTPATVGDGKLCAQIPAGTVNPWDSMIGQDDLPLEQGQPYTLKFDASTSRPVQFHAVLQQAAAPHATVLNKTVDANSTPQTYAFTGTSSVTDSHGQVSFQMGGATEPYTLCLDNISVVGGIVPPGGVRDFGSPVRVNQLGYVADGPKRATYVTTATAPLDWRLLAAGNEVVATGRTTPYGTDALAGDVSRPDLRTVSVGMQAFVGETATDWAGMAAAGVISIVPVVVLFIFLQRYFVEGISGAVKS